MANWKSIQQGAIYPKDYTPPDLRPARLRGDATMPAARPAPKPGRPGPRERFAAWCDRRPGRWVAVSVMLVVSACSGFVLLFNAIDGFETLAAVFAAPPEVVVVTPSPLPPVPSRTPVPTPTATPTLAPARRVAIGGVYWDDATGVDRDDLGVGIAGPVTDSDGVVWLKWDGRMRWWELRNDADSQVDNSDHVTCSPAYLSRAAPKEQFVIGVMGASVRAALCEDSELCTRDDPDSPGVMMVEIYATQPPGCDVVEWPNGMER